MKNSGSVGPGEKVMRLLRDESGQAVVFVALSMTVVLGFVGLATDVGLLLHAKRNLQIAADSAAIAGASALNTSANVNAEATRAATNNGITQPPTVNNPPASGPHSGSSGYVEVIVSQSEPVFFMKLFNLSSMTVAARAVATNGAPGRGCVYALNPAGPDIYLAGSLNVSGCNVVDDSNGSNGIAPVSDPLGSLSPPPYSSCAAPPSSGNWAPGCYSGNITINTAVTMNPGTYVFTGALNLTGGSLTGDGVTLYIAPGGSLGGSGNGNTTLNLTAPSTGPYHGILIYQDRSNTNPVQLNGNSIANLTGIIYIPSAEFDLTGSTNVNLMSDLIVGSFHDNVNATVNISDYSRTVTNPPLTSVALVE